jgi:hypothetical protein
VWIASNAVVTIVDKIYYFQSWRELARRSNEDGTGIGGK